MIVQEAGENRAHYMMRVASAYIREHCPDMTIDYDETTCDGSCIADDLDSSLDEIPANHAIDTTSRQSNNSQPSAGGEGEAMKDELEFEPCDVCGGIEANSNGFCPQCELPMEVKPNRAIDTTRKEKR